MANNRDQVQCNLRDVLELRQERDQLRAELARLQRNEDCVQRLIVWAAENGWNGVDNAKILDSFIIGLFEQLRAELAAAKEQADRAGFNLSDAKGEIAVMSRKLEDCQATGSALAADNARLRDLLDSFAYWGARFGVFAGTKWADEQRLSQEAHWINVYAKEAKDALAATPAQSLAAHDAALLRAMAAKLDGEGHPANEYYRNWLMAEADRIDKEAQRG